MIEEEVQAAVQRIRAGARIERVETQAPAMPAPGTTAPAIQAEPPARPAAPPARR